ncbi:MAG: thiamine biosynthesis protein, partial [Desulfuromonadales bacterium]|nr:thiamine biosynthesis protein [Desulfuromonadales bacterium]
NALRSVANFSGHPDRILRPLSAKALPITPMEEQGLVDRDQLLDIQGRSRKSQEALAREWGLVDYPSSGGGCLLTEKHFSDRLRDLFDHQPDCSAAEVELLKIGRQFRLSDKAKLTLGRHQSDNEKICAAAKPEHVLLHTPGITGPVGLVSGQPNDADIEMAGAITASYGKGKDQDEIRVLAESGEGKRFFMAAPMPREQSTSLIL